MANPLILNQQQSFVGLGTLTFTVPSTGIYNVQCTSTVPMAAATGDGAGSGTGLGSGAGGGGNVAGFAQGGLGLGQGSVGQGFGATSGYQQPPAAGSNETTGPVVSSSLVILVNQNGSTVYTAPALTPTQNEVKFRIPFSFTAADVITVVLSSAATVDNFLNTIQSNVSIGQGL